MQKHFREKNALIFSLGLRFAGEQAFRGSDPLICKVTRQRSRLGLQFGEIWIRSGVCLSAAAQDPYLKSEHSHVYKQV